MQPSCVYVAFINQFNADRELNSRSDICSVLLFMKIPIKVSENRKGVALYWGYQYLQYTIPERV